MLLYTLILLSILILLLSIYLFNKNRDEYYAGPSKRELQSMGFNNEEEEDEDEIIDLTDDEDEDSFLSDIENDPIMIVPEAIRNNNLLFLQQLYNQSNIRFTNWNLIDAINGRNRNMVIFILERMGEPIHPNIYARALQLNYDADILNYILNKINQ